MSFLCTVPPWKQCPSPCIKNGVTQIGQRVANEYAERKSVPHSSKVDKYAEFSKSNLCNFEDCNILMGVCFLVEKTKRVAFPKLI